MSKYVSMMASIFDGFRLDNAHSTPIHVCQYLLQVAWNHNKDLFVMAELFTNSVIMDAQFSKKLNLNGMIRELQNRSDGQGLGTYFHELTCRDAVLGKLDEHFTDASGQYMVLRPSKIKDILYDCTHDNPSFLDKFGSRRCALPYISMTLSAY